MKILQHLLLLSLLVIGCFYPPVWVILIVLAIVQQDAERKQHNDSIPTPVTESNTPVITPATKQAYLASRQWQTLRKAILKRDHYTCQGCGIDGVPLEIHHITYARFEEELESDLVAVCRDCHQAIHDKHDYNYLNTFPLERR